MLDAALHFCYYGVDLNCLKKTFKIAEKHNGIKEKLWENVRKAEAKEKRPKNSNWKQAKLLRQKFKTTL